MKDIPTQNPFNIGDLDNLVDLDNIGDWSEINALQIDIIRTLIQKYNESSGSQEKEQILMCMKSLFGINS